MHGAFNGFDHQNENHVVVDGLAVAAGNVAPNRGVERLTATVAAFAKRGEIGPVARRDGFGNGIDGGNHNHEGACIGGALFFAFIGVGYAHARHSLGVGAGTPHARHLAPVVLVVLHFGPDEIVTGVGHGAVGGRISGAEDGAAGDFTALHHFELHRIPDFRTCGRVEGRAVLPCSGSDCTLIDGARQCLHARIAVLSRRSGQGEVGGSGRRVIGVGIDANGRPLPGWRILSHQCKSDGGQRNRQSCGNEEAFHANLLDR